MHICNAYVSAQMGLLKIEGKNEREREKDGLGKSVYSVTNWISASKLSLVGKLQALFSTDQWFRSQSRIDFTCLLIDIDMTTVVIL